MAWASIHTIVLQALLGAVQPCQFQVAISIFFLQLERHGRQRNVFCS